MVEVGTPDPTPASDQPGVQELTRATNKLRDHVAYERRRRRELYDQIIEDYNRLSHYRSDDRAAFAVAQLENERSIRFLRDELTAACQVYSSISTAGRFVIQTGWASKT